VEKLCSVLRTHSLHSGAKIPTVGFGTSLTKNTKDVVKSAILQAGYRHIDTGSFYKNEEPIGEAIEEIVNGPYDIKREDLFITTKLHHTEKHEVKAALKRSLQKLRVDYVDLYLIHWPINPHVEKEDGSMEFEKIPLYKIWKELEECVNEGLTKHIGLSNFNLQIILDLLTYCKIQPAVNQIELHPYLAQVDLVEYLKKLGIVVVAYSPIGAPNKVIPGRDMAKEIISHETILKLASKYEKTPAQIVLNWGIQRGHVVIPKSSSIERQKENIESLDFSLSKEDVDLVTSLDENGRMFNPKDWHPMKPPMFD